MKTYTDKYDELNGVLSQIGDDGDEAELIASFDAALNCKRDSVLHVIAPIIALHCGFEAAVPCARCRQGRELIKEAISGNGEEWPDILELDVDAGTVACPEPERAIRHTGPIHSMMHRLIEEPGIHPVELDDGYRLDDDDGNPIAYLVDALLI
jgi:hypothetical protein